MTLQSAPIRSKAHSNNAFKPTLRCFCKLRGEIVNQCRSARSCAHAIIPQCLVFPLRSVADITAERSAPPGNHVRKPILADPAQDVVGQLGAGKHPLPKSNLNRRPVRTATPQHRHTTADSGSFNPIDSFNPAEPMSARKLS